MRNTGKIHSLSTFSRCGYDVRTTNNNNGAPSRDLCAFFISQIPFNGLLTRSKSAAMSKLKQARKKSPKWRKWQMRQKLALMLILERVAK